MSEIVPARVDRKRIALQSPDYELIVGFSANESYSIVTLAPAEYEIAPAVLG